jgi:P4 family phage/plasmid primase-like protien
MNGGEPSCLDLLFQPGDIIELRALGKRKNAVQSGFFKDFAKLKEVIDVLDKTGEHKGIYLVLNRINPALYARFPDHLSSVKESIATTSDADILCRRWLPIDFDPVRPTDISSSEEEHAASLKRATEVRAALHDLGWPDPIYADSGNGAHLIYAIDLPNSPEATETIELTLKALDLLFSDNVVKIDIKNYNASRIWKAYGTMTRKGANITDRPWRRSQIIETPTEIKPVPEKLLKNLGWGYTQKEKTEKYGPVQKCGKIDLEQWLSSKGIDVAKKKSAHSGGTMYILDRCPWDSGHVDRSAWTVQFPSGAIAAGCHHNSCSGKGWPEMRRLYEPDELLNTAPREINQAISNLKLDDVADIEYNNDLSIKSVRFNPSKAADSVCQYLEILTTPDKKIWVYRDGYYQSDGETDIDHAIDSIAGSLYNINAAKEVHNKIQIRKRVPFEALDKDPFLFCVKNGVIDLRTGEFVAHSPNYKMTMQSPVVYDPEARPKWFISLLEESCSNDDDRLTLVDWLVACACLVEFEYILFLTGHGGNGKKMYERVVQGMFGSESTEAIALDELTSSKFALGYLRKARVCISTETNPSKPTTEMAKKISGGDWLSSDVKNKDRMRFRPFTQLLWDSNGMPAFEDTSDGFKRRFTRVNMPYHFVDNPDTNDPMQKKKDPQLEEKLLQPEELSGVLNLVILRAKAIVGDRRIHRRENDLEEYEKQAMSVMDFVENFLEFDLEKRYDPEYQISSDLLYSKFEEYKKYTIGAGISRKAFSKLIGKYNGEASARIRISGVLIRGFRGIKFDDFQFKTFIEEKQASYIKGIGFKKASYSIVPIYSGQEEIIGTYNNNSSRDSCDDVPIVPMFRQLLDLVLNNSTDIKVVKKSGRIGTSGHHHAAASCEPNCPDSDFRVRDEDSWELCETCDIPVDPSQQSEVSGLVYCPKCVKDALDSIEKDK